MTAQAYLEKYLGPLGGLKGAPGPKKDKKRCYEKMIARRRAQEGPGPNRALTLTASSRKNKHRHIFENLFKPVAFGHELLHDIHESPIHVHTQRT